jgi:hypothetical protein
MTRSVDAAVGSVAINSKNTATALKALPELQIIDYSQENKHDWSTFVEECDEAWLNHLPEFMDTRRFHRDTTDASFSLRLSGRIAAICTLGVEKHGLGLILSGAGPAIGSDERDRLVKAVKEEACRRAESMKCLALRYHLEALAPQRWRQRFVDSYLTAHEFSYGMRGATMDYEAGYSILSDLSRNIGDINRSFTKGNRAAVKKCTKLGVNVEIFTGRTPPDGAWMRFVELYGETCRRNNLVTFSQEKFAFLRSQVELGRIALVTSSLDGRCLAAILLQTFKRAILYYASGAGQEALKIGAMVHLHATAMEWAKERGFAWYCMGADIPSLATAKNGRIGDFKKRLGNEKWDLLSGERVLSRRSYFARVVLPGALRSDWLVPWLYRSAVRLRQLRVRGVRPRPGTSASGESQY